MLDNDWQMDETAGWCVCVGSVTLQRNGCSKLLMRAASSMLSCSTCLVNVARYAVK